MRYIPRLMLALSLPFGEPQLKRHALRFVIALLIMLPFAVVFTQDEAGISLDIIGVDSTNLSQIAIHASVLDSSGQLVSGLGVDNFSISGALAGLAHVTGVENVTDDDLAFASVLVIDTSSSMAGQPLAQAKGAASAYLNALGPEDPVALVAFNYGVHLVAGFTRDRGLLLDTMDNIAFGGPTALYDATLRAIEIANEAPLPRKAVVILSDGGEYGGVSKSTREESIRAATIHGVPVYSIGLGWDIDQRFLEAIASESNAQFHNAPLAEELEDIYRNLAFLFRSQYIVTMQADVPADGTRYDFTLTVTMADGQSSAGAATLRAPIPIPLVFLPDDLFSEALREDTQISVEIRADQDIESIEVALDGEVVSTDETFTIEPDRQAPGEHQLDITVADVEGDVGFLSTEFEVAALPPTVSDDFAAAAQEDIGEAEVISVDAGGQTEITQVEFIVDGEVLHTDSEAPYEFDLDPFELLPEEHRLSIRATNAGGQTTTVEKTFEVETVPPRLKIEGLTAEMLVSDRVSGVITVEGQSPIVSLSLEPELGTLVEGKQLEFTIDAADFPPGANSIAVRAVDEAGAETVQVINFEVATLAPTVGLSGVAVNAVISEPQEVKVNAGGQTEITRVEVSFDGGPAEVLEAEVFTIPAAQLGDGEHEALVTVTNQGGQSSTISLPFTVQLPPTPTLTAMPTNTATATKTSVPTATNTVRPELSDTPSADEQMATSQAAAALTATPSETHTPLPTSTPLPTETHTPLPTSTPLPTETHTPLPTSTPLPTETHTPLPTSTPLPTETHTPLPTSTPLPTETHTPLPTSTPLPTETHTPLPTSTPLPTETHTPLPTSTPLPTETHTPIPTDTATNTPVPTDTATNTPVPTDTATNTPVPTDTATNTPVPTNTATNTPVPTDTATNTPVPTDTPTNTPVPTDTATNTPVPTDTATNTPIPTDTATNTPVPTDTATNTPVPTDTATNTPIPTDTATNTPVPTDTATNTPVPTDTATNTPVPTDTPTNTPVPTDTATNTPVPTDTATNTPVPTDTATNTPVPTDTATNTPIPTDTPVPTDTATNTPVPTDTPTNTPVPTDTPTDTPIPTDTPVPTDTATDTPVPTDTPTATATYSQTPNSTETAEAESSLTAVVQSALNAEASEEAATETATAELTATHTPTDEPTERAATATDAPTATSATEPTAQPSLTPVTMTEIDAPTADEPQTRDTAIAIAAVLAGLGLLLLLFLVSRRRR